MIGLASKRKGALYGYVIRAAITGTAITTGKQMSKEVKKEVKNRCYGDMIAVS
jgi:hypothetical protein